MQIHAVILRIRLRYIFIVQCLSHAGDTWRNGAICQNVNLNIQTELYKWSAVAEKGGDSLAAIDMGRKEGDAVPFCGEGAGLGRI